MGMLTSVGAHGFGRMAYTLILPEMRDGLSISNAGAGLLASGNLAGYLIFALIGGILASVYGSRIVISLSLLLMGISMMLTGMAASFEFALVMRLLTGIGNGGAYVPAMALGSTWFAINKRGFATGIVTAGTGIGTCLSGIVVPIIFMAYGTEGWSYAWYYLGGAVFVIAAICWYFLKDKPADIGIKQIGAEASENVAQLTETRADSMQWGLVYKVKEVWYIGIVYFLYGFSYVIYMTFFKLFLLESGVADAKANAMWVLVGALSIFCGVIWGGISDLLGRNYGAALAYLILALSYIIFATFNSVGAFYVSAVLFGLTAWSIPTIMAAAAGDLIGPDLAPAGVGFITLFFGIGQVMGPALGGYLRDVTGAFTVPFLVATSISLIGFLGSLLLLKKSASLVMATRNAGIINNK